MGGEAQKDAGASGEGVNLGGGLWRKSTIGRKKGDDWYLRVGEGKQVSRGGGGLTKNFLKGRSRGETTGVLLMLDQVDTKRCLLMKGVKGTSRQSKRVLLNQRGKYIEKCYRGPIKC